MGLEQQSRILVTGGAGLIGSWLIHELNNRGLDQIVVADFLGHDEKWRNLVPLAFADFVDARDLLELLGSDKTPLGALQMLVISREASEMFDPSQKTEQHSHAIEEE